MRLLLEGAPLTVNKAYSLFSLERAKIVKSWRDQAALLGQSQLAKWKRLNGSAPVPVEVIATPVTPGACRQDTGAIMPTVKAIIDGLTDAGFWPDDTSRWVHEIVLMPQRKDRSLSGPGVVIFLRVAGPITHRV